MSAVGDAIRMQAFCHYLPPCQGATTILNGLFARKGGKAPWLDVRQKGLYLTGLSQSTLPGQERQAKSRQSLAEAGVTLSDVPREGILALECSTI